MRRQIRPFTVERKRAGRVAPATEALPPEPLVRLPEPAPVKTFDPPGWAAAEALFSTPAPEKRKAAEPAAAGSTATTGRILQSLIEPPAPTPSYAVEDAPSAYSSEERPKRRGRKPGSRNKISPSRNDEQGPKTIGNVMRSLFEFWANEDEQPAQVQAGPGMPEAARSVPQTAHDFPATSPRLLRRGRAAREDFPRGERWKARLPRFAR